MHSTVQLLAPIPSISHDGFIFVRKNIVEIMRSARYNKCVIDFLLQKKGREKPYHQNRLCRRRRILQPIGWRPVLYIEGTGAISFWWLFLNLQPPIFLGGFLLTCNGETHYDRAQIYCIWIWHKAGARNINTASDTRTVAKRFGKTLGNYTPTGSKVWIWRQSYDGGNII